MVVAASRAIMSPRLQPHLDGDVEKLVGVVWSLRISSGCGDLRIVKELHRQFILLLRLWDRCGKNVGRLPFRNQQYQVDYGGLLKDFVIIFVFLELLCNV